MKEGPNIAEIAALIGDPARANILMALMGGQALTATELSHEAGVTKQTASAHLAKLEGGGLIGVRKQGRHKYYALAHYGVADALEGLMGLAAERGHLRTKPGPRDPALRKARVCYNHLAGDMGIRLYDSLVSRQFLRPNNPGLDLTLGGRDFIEAFGIDLATLEASKAPLCKECLDWSNRRSHLAGGLGRAMFSRLDALGWAKRQPNSRTVLFTPDGERQFLKTFQVIESAISEDL